MTTSAALAVGTLAVPGSAQAQAAGADYRCSAAAIGGTVLGQPIPGPTAGTPDGACVDATGAGLQTSQLPLPITADVLTAVTRRNGNAAGPPRERTVAAIGGVTNLRVRALPELPIRLPLDDVLANVPALSVPLPLLGPINLDLRPAVAALLPDGRLPNLDLVTIDALTSIGVAGCANGAPAAATASQIGQVRVLGQDIGNLNAVTENVLSVIDTTSIDLSDIDLSLVQLPAGLSLAVLEPLVRPLLAALPPIEIPAALATVKLTPGAEQILPDGRRVRSALRIEASLLGQSLVDLVVGQAVVGATGVDCPAPAVTPPAPPPSASELALGCSTRDVALVDVLPRGRRVQLLGVADSRYIGREVAIRFRGTGRVVARPTVRTDGTFTATAAMPSRRLRTSNRARYQASIGSERSLDLKLERRMRVSSIAARSGRVTIAGRIARPLAGRAGDRTVTIEQRVSCTRSRVVGRVAPRADGTFRATVAAPAGANAAIYRMRTRVRKTTTNPKLFPTFTLPRVVDLS